MGKSLYCATFSWTFSWAFSRYVENNANSVRVRNLKTDQLDQCDFFFTDSLKTCAVRRGVILRYHKNSGQHIFLKMVLVEFSWHIFCKNIEAKMVEPWNFVHSQIYLSTSHTQKIGLIGTGVLEIHGFKVENFNVISTIYISAPNYTIT